MKFSREFASEDAARVHEAALLSRGYRAWHTQKADGSWEVVWWEKAA
jgi:hypothetical protein